MTHSLLIDVVTIFPGMLLGLVGESMLGRAAAAGAVRYRATDLREFTDDKHRSVDDRPYGGGPGMVMKAEPFFRAVARLRTPAARVVLMTPAGRPFSQALAADLSKSQHLIFLCGHYEGVDERVSEGLVNDEISIGDYVLTNGTLAAAVVIDALVRLLPGVLGAADATADESFQRRLLEYSQYTRPETVRGLAVPEVLLSGNHADIQAWRLAQSNLRTQQRRPDLLMETEADVPAESGEV